MSHIFFPHEILQEQNSNFPLNSNVYACDNMLQMLSKQRNHAVYQWKERERERVIYSEGNLEINFEGNNLDNITLASFSYLSEEQVERREEEKC